MQKYAKHVARWIHYLLFERVSTRKNNICLLLFRERLSEKMCTRQSRKVIWDISIHCTWHCSCRTLFCCFLLALANICPRPLVSIFQISFKNIELKTTGKNFRDWCVHFFITFLETAVYTETEPRNRVSFEESLLGGKLVKNLKRFGMKYKPIIKVGVRMMWCRSQMVFLFY